MIADKDAEIAHLRAEIEQLNSANHKLFTISMQAIGENQKPRNAKQTDPVSDQANGIKNKHENYFKSESLTKIGISPGLMSSRQLSKLPTGKSNRLDKIKAEAIIRADKIENEIMEKADYTEALEDDFNFENSQIHDTSRFTNKTTRFQSIKRLKEKSQPLFQMNKPHSNPINSQRENTSQTLLANNSSILDSSIILKQQKPKPSNQSSTMHGPSKESISLVFHYSALNYKTESFIEQLRDLTRSLMKTFSATMGELVVIDETVIGLMVDATGGGTKKLREEMADNTEVLVYRTSAKMHGSANIDEAISSNLSRMCNDINQLKFRRRVAFRHSNLLVPISLSFGADSQKLIGIEYF